MSAPRSPVQNALSASADLLLAACATPWDGPLAAPLSLPWTCLPFPGLGFRVESKGAPCRSAGNKVPVFVIEKHTRSMHVRTHRQGGQLDILVCRYAHAAGGAGQRHGNAPHAYACAQEGLRAWRQSSCRRDAGVIAMGGGVVVNDGMMQVQQWVHREGAGCVRDGQRRRALLRTSMEALSGQCDWTHGNGQFVAFEQGSWTQGPCYQPRARRPHARTCGLCGALCAVLCGAEWHIFLGGSASSLRAPCLSSGRACGRVARDARRRKRLAGGRVGLVAAGDRAHVGRAAGAEARCVYSGDVGDLEAAALGGAGQERLLLELQDRGRGVVTEDRHVCRRGGGCRGRQAGCLGRIVHGCALGPPSNCKPDEGALMAAIGPCTLQLPPGC